VSKTKTEEVHRDSLL